MFVLQAAYQIWTHDLHISPSARWSLQIAMAKATANKPQSSLFGCFYSVTITMSMLFLHKNFIYLPGCWHIQLLAPLCPSLGWMR